MMFYHIVAIVVCLAGAGKSQAPQQELLCLNPSKLYPDHNDCQRFVRCVNRKPVSFSCPPKTAFNPETQTCIWRLHLGDCNQEQSGPIWTTAATTTRAYQSLVVKQMTPGNQEKDIPEINHLGTDFEDVVTANEKYQDPFDDLDKILLDIAKQHENINMLSTISNSASKTQIKNENSNMHNVDDSKSLDVGIKSSVIIPVISDAPMITTGKDNSRYSVEENKREDNLKYTSNEDTENGDNSKFILNEATTKMYTLTHSYNPTEFETSTVNLEQRQQMKTGNEQTIVGANLTNVDDSESNKYATGNNVVLGVDDESSKFTPSWMNRMNDDKIVTNEFVKLNDNVISSVDTTTLTSANMAAKEVMKSGETTTVFSLSLPKVIGNFAETSTSSDIATDNALNNVNSEPDEKNDPDDKFQNSVFDSHNSINAQTIERNRVSEESNVDLPAVQSPQNQTEASGNAEEGLTEDNITAILTPFSAIFKLEPSKAREVMLQRHLHSANEEVVGHQHIHSAKEEQMPLEKADKNNDSFKRRKYTHPEDPDMSNDHNILQPTPSHAKDNKDAATKMDDAEKIEASTNSDMNLSQSDQFAVDMNINITSEKHNKQALEMKHDTFSSTNNTEEANSPLNNFQIITKPLDKFKTLGKKSEDNKVQLSIPKKTTNMSTVKENSHPSNSTNSNSNFDFSTLTSRSLLANRTHVTAAAGITHKDMLGSSGTTRLPPQSEAKLNASFMSVPYMIIGLVRPFRCPEPNGHFIDPNNCSVFYHCSRGQAYRRDCPSGQVFHLAAMSCVNANLAPPCHKMDKIKEEYDEERPFRCVSDGYFRDSKQCNVYYICASGASMRMTCDPGTSFDVTYNLCLWNSEVHDCNKPQSVLLDEGSVKKLADKKVLSDISKLQTSIVESDLHLKVPEMPIAQFDCPEAHGLYPDPNNCSVFIHCFKKIPYRHTCQADTVFSAEIGVCTWRELVPECQTEASKPGEEETKLSSVVPAPSGLHQPDVVPEPYKQLLANPGSLQNALITERRKATPLPTFPSQNQENDQQGNTDEVQDFTCPEGSDGFYRDNLFCDIFHRCVTGTRFTFTCPSGTFFRLRGNLCDFWENVVDCTKDGLRVDAVRSLPEIAATLPVPQPLPSDLDLETISIDADPVPCPESSGLFAHPRNCRQFLFCAQYIPLVLTCPESLLYNPLTLTCDLSKNVQCLRYDDYRKV